MRKSIFIFFVLLLSFQIASTQEAIKVQITTDTELKTISPYIYGKNNSLSDDPGSPLSESEWQFLRDAGIKMFRENGGNNSTKYNWRRKLSSHPDWYNNVFPHDWDFEAQSLVQNIPSAQGMWGFQLIGKAAKTNDYNFSSWNYNQAQYWEGVRQNLCGGGQIDSSGGEDAIVDGDTALYLENWTADSTVGILSYWFQELGLGTSNFMYWSMDNEPEIWNSTHDDVWPEQPSAESFMQMYFDVAKKARALFPGIKLVGPVPANEWQWYNWNGSLVNYNNEDYSWLEYFILRIAEEEQATGIRLLDVLDIHFYPEETNAEDIVQLHRVYFDTSYDYPGANGVKRMGSGSWDNSVTKEYIFKRCSDWLLEYLGEGHGVELAVSETGINSSSPNVTANWYASTLGEFAKQGVSIFTPWYWDEGMYEVLHLFSHYGQDFYAQGISSDEEYVSAHPTINDTNDSLTLFLINRHITDSKTIEVDLTDFSVDDGDYTILSLSNLPDNETFVSHTENALKTNIASFNDNKTTIDLPALSVSALMLKKSENYHEEFGMLVDEVEAEEGVLQGVSVATSKTGYSGTGYVTNFNNSSDQLTVTMNVPETQLYKLVIRYNGSSGSKQQNLIIDGQPVSLVSFEAIDSFSLLDAGNYLLPEGENTITIKSNWGYTDFDKFLLFKATKNKFDIAPELADTQALEYTKELYEFLKLQFGKRIISGQTHSNYDDIKTITGQSPLLRVGDFQHFTEGYPYLWVDGGHTFGKHDDGSVDELISWYNNTEGKGIISYQWHWHSPSGGEAGTNTFYTNQTTFDITQAVTPGTQEYDDIIRDIDDIATELKKFQDAGIPILWRPLHEAGGEWFWWGAKGPEPCKALYNILFDRLKNHHQLHNLIWVWSTPEEEWYPGNDKVDIIGYDSYPGDYNYGHQKFYFDELYRLTNGEKLIAMTENGPIPEPLFCLQADAPWLYFMSWSNLVTEQNSNEHIVNVYTNPDVLTLESTNAVSQNDWRSSLYPENWKPGYKDSEGRFLHDFSYVGYHQGEKEIPYTSDNIVDVTQAPYSADNTGEEDVTLILQQALDDVGTAGGGVVFLPAGTYNIAPGANNYALRISYDSTILRGAGTDSTFLFNQESNMRQKNVILVSSSQDCNWSIKNGTETNIRYDLLEPTRIIPVESVSGFNLGDDIILRTNGTEEFIAEHKMTGNWVNYAARVMFLRKIDSIDSDNNLIFIDSPTRYFMKTRDLARVYHAKKHLTESGIENLSVGNKENSKIGWGDNFYNVSGTGAYEVHGSHFIKVQFCQNSWIKNINTYKPETNSDDIHVLSNCLLIDQCRNVTIDSCFFQKPQYEGGGGNGYMFTLQSNDCVIQNSTASHSRHNFDFKLPYTSGNVIYNCRGENSRYSSDFHMWLSKSNLIDNFTVNEDYLESNFRPYGSVLHGYSATQSVFYNTKGEAYHGGKNYIIESKQYGWGYVIGTSGPAYGVITTPPQGSTGGYSYDTSPVDFVEGVGNGESLKPISLYKDQLYRRLNRTNEFENYDVKVIVRDEETEELLSGSIVQAFGISDTTNQNGVAELSNIPGSFMLEIQKESYLKYSSKHTVIISDTTLTFFIKRNDFDVTLRLLDKDTNEPFWGAGVTLNSEEKTTDGNGEAIYNVLQGEYHYSTDKVNYEAKIGSLTINSDTVITIYLTRSHANAKFRLKFGTSPVNNAIVKLGEDSIITNSLGIADFKALPINVSYEYSIAKDGYSNIVGDIFLSTDTTINITMIKATGINEKIEDLLKIWPNPVSDFLNIESISTDYPVEFAIYDILGNSVKSYNLEGKTRLEIDMQSYPAGIYFLNARYKDQNVVLKFIKSNRK